MLETEMADMKLMKTVVLILLVPFLSACTGSGTSRTHDHNVSKGTGSTVVGEADRTDCAGGDGASGSEPCEKSEPVHDHRDTK